MTYLARDQYGNSYHLMTKYPRKELLALFGRQHADKVYIDPRRAQTGAIHIGWIIAGHWLTVYKVQMPGIDYMLTTNTNG